MRKTFWFVVLFGLLLTSCQKKKDRVVAQVYNHKLYASEVQAMLPFGLTTDDSLAFASRIIDSWISEQIILTEAEDKLSMRDKNFQKEMLEYRNSLIRSKYLEKITSDNGSDFVE